MQHLFVSDADIVRVRDGRVSSLIRFGEKKIATGRTRIDSGVSKLEIVIKRIRLIPLSQLDDATAAVAGYGTQDGFKRSWSKHVDGMGDDQVLTVIDLG
jgi:hypothetical protein